MKAKISKLLKLAIASPSGDNCQPWKFKVDGNRLDLYNDPERDSSLFNFRQKASMVAHGAFIENMQIASAPLGLNLNVEIFPDRQNVNHIASVLMEEREVSQDSLFNFIEKRCTNRKKFNGLQLSGQQIASMEGHAKDVPFSIVKIVKEPEKIHIFSKVAATNDRIVFENMYLHNFLFSQIRWSAQEAQRTRDGLDIETLELKKMDAFAFKFLKNWRTVEILNKFGLSKMVSKQAAQLSLSAGGVGVVVMPGNEGKDFVLGGRVMQRVWLDATRLGLSFQPIAGIAFLMDRVANNGTRDLSPKHVEIIRKVQQKIYAIFDLGGGTVILAFRVGVSEPPSQRSLRLPIERFDVSTR